MRRKLLFVTGTRADFGKQKPLMRRIEASDDFKCLIYATGMHTLDLYGLTVNEIYKEQFRHVFSHANQDVTISDRMDLILANTVRGLGEFVQDNRPDLMVVHGDRVETLAGAIVGSFNNILTAHIEGGELSGTIDELIRHSVTKLAHVHFVANEDARKRLIQLGEITESIFVIGSPETDIMLSGELPTLASVMSKYEITFSDYIVFLYHPVTTEVDSLAANVREVTQALRESAENIVLLYPNNDPGSAVILDVLKNFCDSSRYRVIPSMRFEYFLSLLKHSKAIIGNSSSGVREAPVFGVPSINIGSRQSNRVACETIVNVPENKDAILRALSNLPSPGKGVCNFGQGRSGELFLEVLKRESIWETSTQKQFRDIENIRSGQTQH